MSNPEEYNDLFVFCLAITIGMLIIIGRSLEVCWMIEGGDEVCGARSSSKRDAAMNTVLAMCYAAATIYAGVMYYGTDHSSHGGSGSDYESANSTGYDNDYGNSSGTLDGYSYKYNTTGSSDENDNHRFRFLAGDSSYVSEKGNTYNGDVVVALLLASYGAMHVFYFSILAFYIPRAVADGDFNK
jgi:hypothetical protein